MDRMDAPSQLRTLVPVWSKYGSDALGYGRKPFSLGAPLAPLDDDMITSEMYRSSGQTLARYRKLVDAGQLSADAYNAKVERLQLSIRRCERYPCGPRQQVLLASELMCREGEKHRRAAVADARLKADKAEQLRLIKDRKSKLAAERAKTMRAACRTREDSDDEPDELDEDQLQLQVCSKVDNHYVV